MLLESRCIFRRDVKELGTVAGFIRRFASQNDLDPAAHFAVDLAVEELITNMIKYNPQGSPEIELFIEKEPRRLTVKLYESDSAPFDPTMYGPVDTSAALNQRTPGGLGLHLVRSVMDELHYDHAGRRNTITLVKHLNRDNA